MEVKCLDILTNVVYSGLSNAGAMTTESSTPTGCFWNNDTYTNTVYYNFVGDGGTYTITSSNCAAGGTQLTDTLIQWMT